ncbi:MAG: hypothetical protein QG594_2380 [Bacteroidota bacterium]|nr:hypothetical protein [Bacteroidota bacterium]
MKTKLLSLLTFFISFHFFATTNRKALDAPPNSEKIIGVWYSNANRTIKWEYKNDGKLYCYEEGKTTAVFTYTISHTCQGNTDATIDYIKLVDSEKDEYCYKINKVNEGNNGILSLTGMHNQKEVIYVNDVTIKI